MLARAPRPGHGERDPGTLCTEPLVGKRPRMATITSFFRGNQKTLRRDVEAPDDPDSPGGGPPPPKWTRLPKRIKADIKADDATLLAAGVAFYALLALVPALVALVSTYGLVADPEDIQRNVDDALQAAPGEVQNLVSSQLESIVEGSSSGLRVGVIVGLAFALWAASSGVKNMITAVNRAYHQEETRNFLKLRLLALGLTLVFVLLGVAALFVVIAPNALSTDGGEGVARDVLMIARWPLAAVFVILALGIIYALAPNRPAPHWEWLSPGAILATILWLVASVAFSIYTSNFGSYNETYGALGAIVVVMLWLWLGALAVIIGAELNAERERPEEQPAADKLGVT
jgi:membrane protein